MAIPGEETEEAELVFREQADGRKVARLAGGKVVLVDLAQIDRVHDGERWRVRLRHRDTFAIADLVQRVRSPSAPAPAPAAARAPGLPTGSPGAAGVPLTPSPPPREHAVGSLAPAAGALAAPRAVARASADAHVGTPLKVQGMLIEPVNIVRETDRVAFFVDGANMDGAARSAGYFVDYRKVRDYFLGLGAFYAGFYYVADFTTTDPLQHRFLDYLSHAGFIVRRKPVKVIEDRETGERVIKGNLDTEIVLDLLNTIDNYDVAFLFSGDSDFERAVDLLRSRGKRVYVVTSRTSLSRELAYVADKPVFYLEDFRDILQRDDRIPTAAGAG